jgi:ATP citrate (pro-S)-lyase
VDVDGITGTLTHFLLEPFVPHAASDEYYVCIRSTRHSDEILFTPEGGVDVGDVDAKVSISNLLTDCRSDCFDVLSLFPHVEYNTQALRLSVPVDALVSEADVQAHLLSDARVPEARRASLAAFIAALHRCFAALHFAYLEINPLVVDSAGALAPLDLAARLDECARFECSRAWSGAPGGSSHALDFPPPFGRPLLPEEEFVAELDAKTGASLKLTVLNPDARLWTMVAGGGASVIYADTVCVGLER